MMKWIKRIFVLSIISIILLLISVVVVNKYVSSATEGQIYADVKSIPHNRVGLILGSGKFLKSGYINLYYQYRIDATLALYRAGKIDYVLVSGDNSRLGYDEPTTIKKDLMAGGIPENKIVLDYAGFRTLDSVVRSKLVFGLDSITIISQPFHNERAIFLANNSGLTAVAFSAKDVNKRYGFKTQLREKLARVKMMLDLLFGKKPKFLGEKIEI
ncbi:MAG: vancomycin high temperature exclusion protein [Crocinitomicaceae bacterium]